MNSPGDNHRGDSRFADRTAPGRPGFARRCSSALPSRCWSTCTCRTMWTSRILSGRTCWHRQKDDDSADEPSDRLSAPLQMDADATGRTQSRRQVRRQQRQLAKPSGGTDARSHSTSLGHASAARHSPQRERRSRRQVPPPQPPSPAQQAAGPGTVVLDVDSGVVVPSFLGKPLRSAVETAEQSGLEINAIGSGVARQQWPAPGQPSAFRTEDHGAIHALASQLVSDLQLPPKRSVVSYM